MARNEPEISLRAVGAVVVVVMALILGAMAYHQVPEGYEGVQKQWGSVTGNQMDPGAHWIVPVQDSVKHVEIRPRTYTMSDSSGEGKKSAKQDAVVVQTINGSTVRVDVTVRYRVREKKAAEFVRQWNTVEQAEQRLIRPTVRSELRDEAASIETSEIYTQSGRERLAQAAREALSEEFGDEALVLEAVQVRSVDLPKSIDNALDDKEVAKQRIQVEQQRVKQEQAVAKQKRIQAEADAEVIRIKGDALRENPIVLRQRYIDAINKTDKVILGGGVGSTNGTGLIVDGTNR